VCLYSQSQLTDKQFTQTRKLGHLGMLLIMLKFWTNRPL